MQVENAVVVFKLNTEGNPSLSLTQTLITGGKGGASTNAGIVQFNRGLGAVGNYGSNTVTQLLRVGNAVAIGSNKSRWQLTARSPTLSH